MPRRSAAELSVVTGPSAMPVRLKPPPDLDEAERREFLAIVCGNRPDHFISSDAPLVACYARSIVQERTASGELRRTGYVVDDKPSPWASIQKEAQRSMTTLSRILRLNPQSRLPLATKQIDGVSYYEKMALEGKRDDAN